MFTSFKLLLTIISLFMVVLAEVDILECNLSPKTKQGFSLSMQSNRMESGNWMNTFSANGDMSNNSEALFMDLKHEIVDCGEKRKFQIHGTIRESQIKIILDDLTFHPKCGVNVALYNKGRSIKKLNAEDRYNSVVFTNRPLKINELFEVKIDNKVNKLGYFMGIGVSMHSPNEIEAVPTHLASVKTGTWVLFHNHVFNNGNVIVKENVQSLDKLQVGDRVGLMISELGSLHLFVNGDDLGPVASKIPSPVYGAFEFYGDLAQVTITRRS